MTMVLSTWYCLNLPGSERLAKDNTLHKAIEVEVMLDMAPASVNVITGQTNPPADNVPCRQQKLEAIWMMI